MNYLSSDNINWLKQQIWFWILVGVFIMSIFFYITKGLIVVIGGASLGIFLYDKFSGVQKTMASDINNNIINYAKKKILQENFYSI
jgi:hypothetical protein